MFKKKKEQKVSTEQQSKEGIFLKLLSIIKSETALLTSSHFQADPHKYQTSQSFYFSAPLISLFKNNANSAKAPPSRPSQVPAARATSSAFCKSWADHTKPGRFQRHQMIAQDRGGLI